MPQEKKKVKKLLTLFTIFFFLVGFVGDFITTIIWWNRIHPWFSYGIDEGKTVYKCTFSCWILSLIGIILILFLLITFLFFKSLFNFIVETKITLFIFIFVVECVSIGSITFGIFGSKYALRNPSEKGNEDQKCAKYKYKGYLGASIWVSHHQEKFGEYWTFFDKLFKNHSEGYLCRDVGVSTLTFALVQCFAIILSFALLIMFLLDCCKNKNDENLIIS